MSLSRSDDLLGEGSKGADKLTLVVVGQDVELLGGQLLCGNAFGSEILDDGADRPGGR